MVLIQSLRASEKSDADRRLSLDLVQVIFRHGERSPLKEEACMIHITEASAYETDFGLLTKKGMLQEYKLGQMLRKQYNDHLGKYKESEIEALTTLSSRTIMSIELLLAGLFPPTAEEQWNPDLHWKPIPYNITHHSTDIVLAPHMNPKFLKLWISIITKKKEYLDSVAKHSELFKGVEKYLSKSLMNNILFNVAWISSLLRTYKSLNIPFPSWCTQEIYEILINFFSFLIKSMSYTKELKKFNGGPLIRRVIENIEENKGNAAKKIYLYSTHDLTLAGFAHAQDIIKGFDLPPFGSAYIVESYKDAEQQNYIRILSWDGLSDHFVEMEVNNCEAYCPLEKYKSIVEPIIPTDEELRSFQCDLSNCNTFDLQHREASKRFSCKLPSNIHLNRIIISAIAISTLTIPAVFLCKKLYSSFYMQVSS